MGEARKKHQRHQDILRNSQGCIYCAGKNPSTQIDHMPPRAMFRLAQRPKGLEFASCAECNQGTSRLDIVGAFMARTFPGAASERENAEWTKLLNEVQRAAPGLLNEMMWANPHQMMGMQMLAESIDENLAALKGNGPILSSYMQAFAAKIGFALHYESTGQFVPENGRIQVRWFTSGEIFGERIPTSLLESIEQIDILKQGRITSEYTFEYGWGLYKHDNSVRVYYAKIRDSFVVSAFFAETVDGLPFQASELATFSPGDLSGLPFDRIRD
jgi:hypothetical protein